MVIFNEIQVFQRVSLKPSIIKYQFNMFHWSNQSSELGQMILSSGNELSLIDITEKKGLEITKFKDLKKLRYFSVLNSFPRDTETLFQRIEHHQLLTIIPTVLIHIILKYI